MLRTTQSMEPLNDDWTRPLRRLLFHLDTINSQSAHLEDDFKIDKTPPIADPTVVGLLETYAR